MRDAYRDDVEAARARDAKSRRRRLAGASVIAVVGVVVGAVGAAFASARPGPVIVTATAPIGPPDKPEPAARREEPKPTRTSVSGAHALATPNAGSGHLEVVIADHAVTCSTVHDPPSRDGACPSAWRLRLSLPPDQRDVGVHRIGPSAAFAYADRQRSVAYGGPSPGAICKHDGRDAAGTIEVISSSSEKVVLRLDTDELEGVVEADVCDACKGTGMTCSSSDECCTRNCGGGRCHP